MKNKTKTLKSFALNKQAISKLQMENTYGGVESDFTIFLCTTHPKLCAIEFTKDSACRNVTSTCNPTGPTSDCTVA